MREGTRLISPSFRTWQRAGIGWERPAATALILFMALIHVAYLLRCPLELAPDEAHYWDWSRHLDWSYYSKGPLVAWIIRLSCELFGGMSERVVGSPLLAIRLPAIFFSLLSLVATYLLTRRITESERVAFWAVVGLVTMPMTAAGNMIMTIDAPFVCLWAWALVFGHDALFRNRRWAWPVVGLLVGLGILAKYTMVLWVVGLLGFLLTTPYRRELLKPGIWIAAGITAICCIPIVVWNVQHDWITLRHVGTQAGTGVASIRWFGPIRYITEQMGLLLVVWFFLYVGAMWANRPRIPFSLTLSRLGRGDKTNTSPNERSLVEGPRLFLWWSSAAAFGTFLLASFKTPGQINWPIAAYVPGLVLAFDWLMTRIENPNWRRSIMWVGIIGMILNVLQHYPAILRQPFVFVADLAANNRPCPIRSIDPSVRLRGWRFLASEVDRMRLKLATADETPVLATTFWNLAGEIAVHCEGQPTVYCLGPALAQRMSQYDLWRPNPLWDPEDYAGRTFILIGDLAPELTAGFDNIESTRKVWYREDGHPVNYWQITVARGYRGFGPPNRWPGGPKF